MGRSCFEHFYFIDDAHADRVHRTPTEVRSISTIDKRCSAIKKARYRGNLVPRLPLHLAGVINLLCKYCIRKFSFLSSTALLT
jgi:hypothetical protein